MYVYESSRERVRVREYNWYYSYMYLHVARERLHVGVYPVLVCSLSALHVLDLLVDLRTKYQVHVMCTLES